MRRLKEELTGTASPDTGSTVSSGPPAHLLHSDLVLDIADSKHKSFGEMPPENEPLLDMSTSEKSYHIMAKLLWAYSNISGVTGAIVGWVTGMSALIQVATYAALGGVGAIAGLALAYIEINFGKSKIIKLNKILFTILNIAADLRDKLKIALASDDKKKKLKLTDKYHKAVIAVLDSVSSPEISLESLINENSEKFRIKDLKKSEAKGDDKKSIVDRRKAEFVIPTLHYSRIDSVILKYSAYRKINSHHLVWKTLSGENRFFRSSTQFSQAFNDHVTQQEIKDFYQQKRKEQIKKYQDCIVELDDALSFHSHDLPESWRSRLKKHVMNILGNNDFHDAECQVLPAYQLEFERFSDNDLAYRSGLQTMMNKMNRIVKVVISNDDNKRILLELAKETDRNFGENGEFRHFWRALPKHKSTDLTGAEFILHFEKFIHRNNSPISFSTKGILCSGVFMGLLTTGNTLYKAIVDLGANEVWLLLEKFNLIVLAMTLLLTLGSYLLINKTLRMQNNRDELIAKMKIYEDSLRAQVESDYQSKTKISSPKKVIPASKEKASEEKERSEDEKKSDDTVDCSLDSRVRAALMMSFLKSQDGEMGTVEEVVTSIDATHTARSSIAGPAAIELDVNSTKPAAFRR